MNVEVPTKGVIEFPDWMNSRDIEHAIFANYPELADTPQKKIKADLLQQRADALEKVYSLAPDQKAWKSATDTFLEEASKPCVNIPRPGKLEPGPQVPLPVAVPAIHAVTSAIDTVFDKAIGAIESIESPLGAGLALTGMIAPKTVSATLGIMGGAGAVEGIKETAQAVQTGSASGIVGGVIDAAMGAAMIAGGTEVCAAKLH